MTSHSNANIKWRTILRSKDLYLQTVGGHNPHGPLRDRP